MNDHLICKRYPYSAGECDGGSDGMKCEIPGCENRSWSVWLTAEEWNTIWKFRDMIAWHVICQKKLGLVLCDEHNGSKNNETN